MLRCESKFFNKEGDKEFSASIFSDSLPEGEYWFVNTAWLDTLFRKNICKEPKKNTLFTQYDGIKDTILGYPVSKNTLIADVSDIEFLDLWEEDYFVCDSIKYGLPVKCSPESMMFTWRDNRVPLRASRRTTSIPVPPSGEPFMKSYHTCVATSINRVLLDDSLFEPAAVYQTMKAYFESDGKH